MPTFNYQAIDEKGQHSTGEMVADSELALGSDLENLGLYLIRAKQTDAEKEKPVFKGKIVTRDLIDFTHHLIMVFESARPSGRSPISTREGKSSRP